MTANPYDDEEETISCEGVVEESGFLKKKLVNCNGIMIYSYLGSEPDHRFDRDHEREEE